MVREIENPSCANTAKGYTVGMLTKGLQCHAGCNGFTALGRAVGRTHERGTPDTREGGPRLRKSHYTPGSALAQP